jgi:hypothetical protein
VRDYAGDPAVSSSSSAIGVVPTTVFGADCHSSDARILPKLSLWISNRMHASRMREVERYLSQATDLADLERRIVRIERSARWH